jgi:hypothetical protein
VALAFEHQKAIDESDGTRPSPVILAAAIPTATCPRLAMFPASDGPEPAAGDEDLVGAGLELGMVEAHGS